MKTYINFLSSYGGMLSGYMRYKYPHIITAAVASSAPFYTIAGNRPRNEFFQAVTNVNMYYFTTLTFLLFFAFYKKRMTSKQSVSFATFYFFVQMRNFFMQNWEICE